MLSTVFSEFPQRIKDWSYEVEDFRESLNDILIEKLRSLKKNLENTSNRLSPVKLASKLNEKKTRLAVLKQRTDSAIQNLVDAKDEKLKIKMASLDALSPLAVLNRGFAIAENDSGEILRSAEKIKTGDEVKILLSNGKLKTRVLKVEKK